ncbi:hypothetical protein ATEIFO6365_0013020400 [Aspergillus terreus]|uniref:Uncharacterized protein n=1 Tax=Aspergillus terreus TaxID=33178 RepID=A0A5M3ZD43_ASPTE|nr:hypothetical protein ATETN484_0014020400 [Aspergillus terreus]GFF20870.1 hypothetical protein ATEIFO6365_0013020400 [Aspergillus terreus]
MSAAQEQPEHKALRHAVRNIESSLLKIPSMQYTLEDLSGLPIRCLPMPLSNEGYPQFKPCFFEPFKTISQDPEAGYPAWELPEGWPEDSISPMDRADSILIYLDEYIGSVICNSASNPKDSPAYWHMPSSSDRYPTLWEHNELSRWVATFTSDYNAGPHFKCMMISDVHGDDRLTRSELLCACRIMIMFLSSRRWMNHMVTPVMLLSFMGGYGRILLVHHDGSQLIVRKSKLFDFREKNTPALKLFLRWWCSSHVGDTLKGALSQEK